MTSSSNLSCLCWTLPILSSKPWKSKTASERQRAVEANHLHLTFQWANLLYMLRGAIGKETHICWLNSKIFFFFNLLSSFFFSLKSYSVHFKIQHNFRIRMYKFHTLNIVIIKRAIDYLWKYPLPTESDDFLLSFVHQ